MEREFSKTVFVIIVATLLFGLACADSWDSRLGTRPSQTASRKDASLESTVNYEHPKPRFLGLDVSNDATNFEAEMWLVALVGIAAAAIPSVFLDPSLGFRRALDDNLRQLDDEDQKMTTVVEDLAAFREGFDKTWKKVGDAWQDVDTVWSKGVTTMTWERAGASLQRVGDVIIDASDLWSKLTKIVRIGMGISKEYLYGTPAHKTLAVETVALT